MKNEQFIRTEALIGAEAAQRLYRARVLIFGVGGVGSFAAEALARAGIGAITVVDGDTVAPSNINRQLIALHSTLGRAKAEVMAERIADINPNCEARGLVFFYTEQTASDVDFSQYTYIADCVDMVSAKLLIASRAHSTGVRLISCMGAGNKTDASRFEVADIYGTSVCPLARVMRRELRARGIDRLKVVYSREEPFVPGQRVPPSISYVPSAAGLLAAGAIIKDIINNDY